MAIKNNKKPKVSIPSSNGALYRDKPLQFMEVYSDKVGRWDKLDFDRNWDKCAISTQKIFEIKSDYHNKKDIKWKHLFSPGFKYFTYYKLDYCKKNFTKEVMERLEILMQRNPNIFSIEEIFAFKPNGTFRLFGVRKDDIFYAIWHDPEHQFYRLELKHT